jgi:hypothetical protein
MAQTTNHLRDLLEKIKADAKRALALLASETELRSLGWKCIATNFRVRESTRLCSICLGKYHLHR